MFTTMFIFICAGFGEPIKLVELEGWKIEKVEPTHQLYTATNAQQGVTLRLPVNACVFSTVPVQLQPAPQEGEIQGVESNENKSASN